MEYDSKLDCDLFPRTSKSFHKSQPKYKASENILRGGLDPEGGGLDPKGGDWIQDPDRDLSPRGSNQITDRVRNQRQGHRRSDGFRRSRSGSWCQSPPLPVPIPPLN